jgi:hypothetical protein
MDVTRHTRAGPGRSLPRALSALALRHPLRVVIAAASLAILGFVLAATRLTGRGDLVADGERYRQLDARYEREFEELPERVVVVIANDAPESSQGFASALERRPSSGGPAAGQPALAARRPSPDVPSHVGGRAAPAGPADVVARKRRRRRCACESS